MRPPFPGMDPWLELPALWLDVHNSLITAIRDDMASRLAPKYFVGVEQHAYVTSAMGDLATIRPDVLVGRSRSRKRIPTPAEPATAGAGVLVMDVEMPVEVQVEDWYLEIRVVGTSKRVTVIEVISPWNKSPGPGRKEYLRKRKHIGKIRTSLVEVDLLRGGKPMPLSIGQPVESDDRILVSPGRTRPRAKLYPFGVRQPIPAIPIPLLPKDPSRRWISTPCRMPCTSGRGSIWYWTTPGPRYLPWKRKTPPGRGRSSRGGKITGRRPVPRKSPRHPPAASRPRL